MVQARLFGMSESGFDRRVDDYIKKAAPFAQPVMEHLRALVHKACPEVEETMKWSMPFFIYHGQILANVAAFKQHCSFGIWGKDIAAAMRKDGFDVKGGMGVLGKVASVKELPKDSAMLGYLRQSMMLVDGGGKTFPKRGAKKEKPEAEVPAELGAALKKNKEAAKVFREASPGFRREYAAWIDDAKREETKAKRVAQAVEWIAEGKARNWKYEKS
ncbi:hypothetical protein GCM10011507_23070 [Edaphobacter acidisoli]|uniref:YdhG-like domain-containing protein n=1 Tax=Edaphobacter acidisoli TaxID=2040573 RepID=A0A916RVA5_9BACT|nr:YdeI/OmpD-associated family protein [Edaphobacter acidisoli]GGA70884.1 hypothetical protein GCM10011507_23070 [Edaphobacter acidisoli]